jgi:hypothetical protein
MVCHLQTVQKYDIKHEILFQLNFQGTWLLDENILHSFEEEVGLKNSSPFCSQNEDSLNINTAN